MKLIIFCLLLATTFAQTAANFDKVSSETKEAHENLKTQVKELGEAENKYMAAVAEFGPLLDNVIKESSDVETAEKVLATLRAKDKAANKKAAERDTSNIERQTEATQNAQARQSQLIEQKITSVDKAVERTESDTE